MSILFIDSDNDDGDIILMDASKLGTKVKEDGKNQKTVLRASEIENIIEIINSKKSVDDFSAIVSHADIDLSNYVDGYYQC